VRGRTRLNGQTVICRVDSGELDSSLESLLLSEHSALVVRCVPVRTQPQASHGVSKIASPSNNAEHPLPIAACDSGDARLAGATRSGRSAFAVYTTLTVCSTQRLMPASSSRHRSLCIGILAWTSADHEVHFFSSVSALPLDTSRCCGELPGVLTPTDASEMLCPSERSPPQQLP
jgi:hypothetical protein